MCMCDVLHLSLRIFFDVLFEMALTALFPVAQAQAVALTVAQAFTVAFELWQEAKDGRKLWRTWVICKFTVYVDYLLFSSELCVVSLLSRLCFLEKGKRAKSGSAGEASSSSHSERSSSLGSLKGTGRTISIVQNAVFPTSDTLNLKRMNYNVFTMSPFFSQMPPPSICWIWRTVWRPSSRQMEI